jgi:hypothetical protein
MSGSKAKITQFCMLIFIFFILNLKQSNSKVLREEVNLDNLNSSLNHTNFLNVSNKNNNNDTMKLSVKRNTLSETGGKTIFNVLKKDLIDGLEKMQSSINKRGLECMPGSVFYNGTCIFISSKRQKLSWVHAERFCRRLPLNTTFLVLQNDHKSEFIRRELTKLREKENPLDPLLFYIGFRYVQSKFFKFFFSNFFTVILNLKFKTNGNG